MTNSIDRNREINQIKAELFAFGEDDNDTMSLIERFITTPVDLAITPAIFKLCKTTPELKGWVDQYLALVTDEDDKYWLRKFEQSA